MSLSTFNDFMQTTGKAVITGPEQFVNEATERSYTLNWLMRGKGPQEVLQGGSSITDQLMFDESNTYENYAPQQTFTWQIPQVLDEWSTNWRFGIDHKAWDEHTVVLNAPSGFGKGARHHAYKSMKSKLDLRVKTSIANGLEAELWRVPVAADMEAASGLRPMSIPALINAETNGLYTGWTTKQGINPATEAKWRPQQVSYPAYVPTATLEDGTAIYHTTPLIEAFDTAYIRHRFDMLPMYGNKSEAPTKATVIFCSEVGENFFVQNLRFGNDTWVMGKQDPAYDAPMYHGIPVVYVSALDTAPLYSGATESAVTEDGPRYYWVNRNYFKPVFHNEYYMKTGDVMRHPNQPTTYIQIVQCWHNYIATSLRRHAIVYPAA